MRNLNECISIIGMRASGKTTLGTDLAQDLGYSFLDTDQDFVAEHGSINDFVAKNGWPVFRELEEQILRRSVRQKRILSTGGGVIEREANQNVLQAKTRVVWIQAELHTILERLMQQTPGEERPALTSLPQYDEVRTRLELRNPLWEKIAEVVVPATMPTDEQIQLIRKALDK